jgi:hypothetical protein
MGTPDAAPSPAVDLGNDDRMITLAPDPTASICRHPNRRVPWKYKTSGWVPLRPFPESSKKKKNLTLLVFLFLNRMLLVSVGFSVTETKTQRARDRGRGEGERNFQSSD